MQLPIRMGKQEIHIFPDFTQSQLRQIPFFIATAARWHGGKFLQVEQVVLFQLTPSKTRTVKENLNLDDQTMPTAAQGRTVYSS